MSTQQFAGTVQSGGTGDVVPLAGAHVALYAAGTAAPTLVGSARSGADGRFAILAADPAADGVFYLTAELGGATVLAAVIGPEYRETTVVNELTTVAAAFAFAQFTEGGAIMGDSFALRIASGMCDNLVDGATGASSAVLLASPNADETNSLRSTRALANLLVGCTRQVPGAVGAVMGFGTPPGGSAPVNTFQAMVNVARNPAENVGAIYAQAQVSEAYLPSLTEAPDAWTLTVKVNDSGDDAYMFGGPANVAFDDRGYAWIANNVIQGQPYSAKCIMVLRPDGRPSDGRDGTPKSPVSGGGIWGPGLGITVDPHGHAWVGNYGWGKDDNPPAGSVSEFRPDGTPVSRDEGYTYKLDRVQATVADRHGNIWMASYGSGELVVYRRGREDLAVSAAAGDCTFGIALTEGGGAWVTNSGGLGWPRANPSTVCHFQLVEDPNDPDVAHLRKTMDDVHVGAAVKAVVTDRHGYAWIASGGDNTVYRISPAGQVQAFTAGGIDGPWGINVDGDDNVWVANFGPLGLGADFTTGRLTVLAGDTEKNRAAGLRVGDPISPPTGYTVKSAGSPVLLANGEPLYGPDGPDSFAPLMRATACTVDRAGNVWVVNNWKPDFDNDFPPETGNPGGDGIVIFVGLAAPPRA